MGLSCGLTPPFCQTDISGEYRSIDVFEKKDNRWQARYSEITKAKKRFGLAEDAPVHSCYEAGRDGFWLHRFLESRGIANLVVDSSSIEVKRRGDVRRAKLYYLRDRSGKSARIREKLGA